MARGWNIVALIGLCALGVWAGVAPARAEDEPAGTGASADDPSVETTAEPARAESRPGASEDQEALPLAPRRQGKKPKSRSEGAASLAPDMGEIVTKGMAGLAAVVLLFLVFTWGWKKSGRGGGSRLPSEVVEVLGRSPLPNRQQLQLVRCGRKLLLLCVSPQGTETLTEITDPEEVEHLAALCQQASPHSATALFREILSDYEREPARGGFVDAEPTDTARRERRRGDHYA